jgi:hypothetical protein
MKTMASLSLPVVVRDRRYQKTNLWQHPVIWTWGLNHGVYHCQIHDHEIHVTGDYFSFVIPPREAQMWLYVEQ